MGASLEGASGIRGGRLEAEPAAPAAQGRLPAAVGQRPLPAGPAELPVPAAFEDPGGFRPARAWRREEAALSHLDALSDNDVVVYDRGYFSHVLLREHVARGLHPVFRLQANANGAVTAFADGAQTDTVIELAAGPGPQESPARLRLVKYAVSGSPYLLGTTLLDRKQYGIARTVGPVPRALGHRGAVQGVEAAHWHRGLPRAERARGEAGAVRALCPDRPDAAVLPIMAKTCSVPAGERATRRR